MQIFLDRTEISQLIVENQSQIPAKICHSNRKYLLRISLKQFLSFQLFEFLIKYKQQQENKKKKS